ncbi:calcium-binding protein [Sinimarinibacterium sp. CAU 1509]|uniref:calcium-binding protein n=1 Tax=Sinimarinibacterium sp. CAU 1509 TaxID=2562283 RepID=UPI001B7FE130|nr:hypothetical protein [Sinimarinibacterium sp. CAU 1509]
MLNADHGIAGAFTVNTVRIGVQEAGTSGSQPIELRLYSIPSTAPLVFANLTSIGSAAATVNDGTLFFMDIPVSGTVLDPTTEDLVVDIHVPGGAPYFFPGANSAGQTGPTYLAAATCMLPEITDIATQGFPDDNIVMLVSGEELSIIPEECGPGFEDANIIVGTEDNDVLSGTPGKDVIFGLDGDDNINGSNGDDCLIGGYGNDYLFGGAGNDVLIAGEAAGSMMPANPASQSRDRLNGSRGTDTCYGSTDYYYGKRNGPSYYEGPSYRTTYDNCETVIEQTMYPYPD